MTLNKLQRKTVPRAKIRGRKGPRSLIRPSPGALFEALVKLQTRLLGPKGCPWDREQTHESLRTYLLEEAYEVLDALESGDDRKFSSELGDLLLQIIFHAELARQAGHFDIGTVIQAIHTKMVRRHPHVFGRNKVRDTAEVLKNWEQIKLQERREEGDSQKNVTESLLDGVPTTLPAVLQAYQMTRRAARVGFDWDSVEGILEKLTEESRELREALAQSDTGKIEEEVGDLLFVAVNVARYLKFDPEIALRKSNRKFAARFRSMERHAADSGRKLAVVPRAELEGLWEAVKLEGPSIAAGTQSDAYLNLLSHRSRRLKIRARDKHRK